MPLPTNRNRTVIWKPMVVCPQPEMHRQLQSALAELSVEQPCNLAEYPHCGPCLTSSGTIRLQHLFHRCRKQLRPGARPHRRTGPRHAGCRHAPANRRRPMLRCLRKGAGEFLAELSRPSQSGEIFERFGRAQLDPVHRVAGHPVLRRAWKAGSGRQHAGRPPGRATYVRGCRPRPAG